MRNETRSLYQVLDVGRDAAARDIERAYRRIKSEMQKETAPPDPRRRALVEHAHDVLMDPARRAAYDREWDTGDEDEKPKRRSRVLAAAAVAIVLAAIVAWMLLRRSHDEAALALKDIQQKASLAIGRVTRIDVSGAATPLGIAFAIDEGTLVTSCDGLAPGAELQVRFGKRAAPVRASAIDAPTGLCTLTGSSVGSWPLVVSSSKPAVGQTVYVVTTGTAYEPVLRETRVSASGNAIAVEAALGESDAGSPLLDALGRVVGVATRGGVYVALPRSWGSAPAGAPQPSNPPSSSAAAEPATPAPAAPAHAIGIQGERRERIEKAFSPPPTKVPDDL